jgi:hypothetical protein
MEATGAGGDDMNNRTARKRLLASALAPRNMPVEEIRALHFGTPSDWDTAGDQDWQRFVAVAASMHPPVKTPYTPPGGINFFRLHALALDRLEELLDDILPNGFEGPSCEGNWCWHGSHPNRPELVLVCMLGGGWSEPNTGKSGKDLVSLYGRIYGVSNGRAAHLLAEWLNADVVAHA